MQISITVIIIIITVLVSLGAFRNGDTMNKMIFHPPSVARGEWYRLFTSGLIHADESHLIFNMISLWFFGPYVEDELKEIFGAAGGAVFIIMYISAIGISLLPTYAKHKNDRNYYGLGASGAVSAVLFAGLLVAPTAGIGLIFIPFIRIPGFLFGPIYLLISAYLDRRGKDNINHSAHIWGGLYGLAFLIIACRLVDYNILSECINTIRIYMIAKGWIS